MKDNKIMISADGRALSSAPDRELNLQKLHKKYYVFLIGVMVMEHAVSGRYNNTLASTEPHTIQLNTKNTNQINILKEVDSGGTGVEHDQTALVM